MAPPSNNPTPPSPTAPPTPFHPTLPLPLSPPTRPPTSHATPGCSRSAALHCLSPCTPVVPTDSSGPTANSILLPSECPESQPPSPPTAPHTTPLPSPPPPLVASAPRLSDWCADS